MKKLVIFLMITGLLWLFSCTADQPSSPTLDVTISQLALSKLVTVGNSLTAGFQSSGLSEDMQMHSYGYLIAKQINPNGEFEQPLISAPGIGSPAGKTPQSFNPATGAITQADLTVNPLTPRVSIRSAIRACTDSAIEFWYSRQHSTFFP